MALAYEGLRRGSANGCDGRTEELQLLSQALDAGACEST